MELVLAAAVGDRLEFEHSGRVPEALTVDCAAALSVEVVRAIDPRDTGEYLG